jgi:hypothetical protein
MENMTAVEWLEANMPNLSKYISQGMALELLAKFQQAKQMEREQIVTANADGQYLQSNFLSKNQCFRNAEYYYTETFKK